MTTLDIDETYHQYLQATCALSLDADGNETLVGLTSKEASEYVNVMAATNIAVSFEKVSDPEGFLALYNRHNEAFLSLVPITQK